MAKYWNVLKDKPEYADEIVENLINSSFRFSPTSKIAGFNWLAFDTIGDAFSKLEDDFYDGSDSFAEIMWKIQLSLEFLIAQQLLFTEKLKSDGADFALEVSERLNI